jgi:hypothetical protein
MKFRLIKVQSVQADRVAAIVRFRWNSEILNYFKESDGGKILVSVESFKAARE